MTLSGHPCPYRLLVARIDTASGDPLGRDLTVTYPHPMPKMTLVKLPRLPPLVAYGLIGRAADL